MEVFVGQRKNEISVFKLFLISALKICNPDTVLISSGFYTDEFWNCDSNLRTALENKDIFIAGKTKKGHYDINDLGRKLGKALINPSRVTACPLDSLDAGWGKNEISLIKKNKTEALIMGSSNCAIADLDCYYGSRFHKINTDILICDDSYVKEINSYFFGDMERGEKPGICEDYPELDLGELPIIREENLLDAITKNTKDQINLFGPTKVF